MSSTTDIDTVADILPDVFDAENDREVLIEQARKKQEERRRQQQQLSQQQQQPDIFSNSKNSWSSGGAGISSDDPEWKFFDTARINVSGGNGGNGCVAFRREKGEAMGGPNGGRGGNGGSVWLVCDETINTLAPLRNNRVHVRAQHGKNGLGKNKDGSKGERMCSSKSHPEL